MLELATPWALGLLPIPFFVWYILPKAKPFVEVSVKVPFFQGLNKALTRDSLSVSKQKGRWLPLFIWALLVFALSGPRYVGEPRSLEREAFNILMVLDLSGSMEIMDMQVNGRPVTRLSVVKEAAKQFVSARTMDKIGLILFGTRAYLQTPLTFDKHHVLMRIDDASAGLAGQTTSIGDALGLAVKRLSPVSKKGRVIILLTDGANNSGALAPLKAAELAKEQGMKVYTIGLGSEANDFFMPNAGDSLDEDTLQQIAKTTGGQYFRATDPDSLKTIYKTIDRLETVKQEGAMVRAQKEYYPWLLALAWLLTVYGLTKKINWTFSQAAECKQGE